MEIAILGGGNFGTLLSCEFTKRGHNVRLLVSDRAAFHDELTMIDNDRGTIESFKIHLITSDVKEAVTGARLVVVTYPSFLFARTAERVLPYAEAGQIFLFNPGSGGVEFVFQSLLEKGCILAGLQRVYCVARINETGVSVFKTGVREKLHLGCIPQKYTEEIAKLVKSLFDVETEALPNYLNITLTPSNPILHTTRLCSLFKDYRSGMVYPRNKLFYEEWDDATSELLFRCDGELQEICDEISKTTGLSTEYVRSLREHYESSTPEALTRKIKSIRGFKGLYSPMKETDGGFVPDFDNRYFSADFPFGLQIIREFARVLQVKTPCIDEVWAWYSKFNADKPHFSFADYGVASKNDLTDIYR